MSYFCKFLKGLIFNVLDFYVYDKERDNLHINPLPPSDAVSLTEKNILEYLFSWVLSQFKKYHPSGNLKFNYLGISQSLKLLISMEKIISISLKLYFTPNN